LFLLAMLPVAAYFIGPLVWKRIPGGKVRVAQAAPRSGLIEEAPGTTAELLPDWQTVVEQMSADVRMRAAPARAMRNPFQLAGTPAQNIAAAATDETADHDHAQQEARDTGPEPVGLRLTATIVGQRLQMATINGKPYRVNARIPLPSDEASSPEGGAAPSRPTFVLKSVARKFVVLEHDGKLYQLNLAR
jgi:hypothetical protein